MLHKIILSILLFTISYMLVIDKEDTNQSEVIIQTKENNPLLKRLIETAHSYEGTPYKFGGTTVAGMDCSGLVYTSYKAINITLARSSKNMFYEGKNVDLTSVNVGDLLFFNIDRLSGEVNHVGMVSSVDEDNVYFTHSTTKKGVIISSIKESYWKKAFVKAKRILN